MTPAVGLLAFWLTATAMPETTQVNLPTLHLGEYVIYGIDTLHLRRAPIALWPSVLDLPDPPLPVFPISPFLTTQPLPVVTLTPREIEQPGFWNANLWLGSYPSGSATLKWRTSSRSAPRFSGLFGISRTRGHVENAQRTSWLGLIAIRQNGGPVPFQADLNTHLASFGYYMLDSTRTGARKSLNFLATAQLWHQDESEVQAGLIYQRSRQDLDTPAYSSIHSLGKFELSGNWTRGAWTVLESRIGVQIRKISQDSAPIPEIASSKRVTELHLVAGVRSFWNRWTWQVGVGVSRVTQDSVSLWPLAQVQAVYRVRPPWNLGVRLFSERTVEPQHVRWLYIFPRVSTFERRAGFSLLTSYATPRTHLQMSLTWMHRAQAEIVDTLTLPSSSMTTPLFVTTQRSFQELRWEASGRIRLARSLSVKGNLQFRWPSKDFPYEPRLMWTATLRWNTGLHGIAWNGKIEGQDRYVYTHLAWGMPLGQTGWQAKVGVRNLFDQPQSIFGRDTGGRREIYFVINWEKEVVP